MKMNSWPQFEQITPSMITALSASRQEPPWLSDFRLKAFERLNVAAVAPFWPSTAPIGFSIPPNRQEIAEYHQHPDEADLVYQRLSQTLSDSGIIYGDFYEVLQKYPDIIRQYLGSIITIQDSPLSALNSAFFTGGMVVYIPDHVHCQVPLSYFRAFANPGQIERQLIILGTGASAEFVEGRPSLDYAPHHIMLTEVILSESSSLKYTAIKNWDSHVNTWVKKRTRCAQGAHVTWVEGHFGGQSTREWTEVILTGDHAHCDIVSYLYSATPQNISYVPRIIHDAPHSSSCLTVHGVATGDLQIIGEHDVLPHAQGVTIQRDLLALQSLSAHVSLSNPSIIAEPDAEITGNDFVIQSWNPLEAYENGRALEIAHAFLAHLPMEFAIEAQRLIHQKSHQEIPGR
ncbi:SufD family Fe-S cluster assembly protein [Sulfobacillus thermosulfidooxidans]|uniref:SufD family Fe-S cluster assembly protein n=1 Tax=Sulfobacillus thermosulfidooxidans TaxID=28034 RepID=UPI0006B3FBB7|nr:SufD family Fe-S cluster assembly protein [Sulfobacillus thermosulfidooxidans]